MGVLNRGQIIYRSGQEKNRGLINVSDISDSQLRNFKGPSLQVLDRPAYAGEDHICCTTNGAKECSGVEKAVCPRSYKHGDVRSRE